MRKVCPSRWLIPVPGPARGAGHSQPTWSLQLAHQVPAPPAGQPPIAGARWAAVRARARRRRRSPPFSAEPAASARQPPPPLRASLLWPLLAPSERCLRFLRSGAGTGGRGEGREGGAGSAAEQPTGSRASRRPRAPPPTRASAPLRPAGPRVALRSGSVHPRAFGLRRALGAAPEGAAVSVSPLGGLVRAQSGPGEHGLKVGVPLLGKLPTAALPQVRKDGQF